MNNNYELGKVIVALNINITSKDVLDYYIDLVQMGLIIEKARNHLPLQRILKV